MTWLPRVYLTVTALAQVRVCKTPYLCLLVFIWLCPVYPLGLEATTAHPAPWYHRPSLCALTSAHSSALGSRQPVNMVPPPGRGSAADMGWDARTPLPEKGGPDINNRNHN